jgi:hypothetical protein
VDILVEKVVDNVDNWWTGKVNKIFEMSKKPIKSGV